MKGYGVLLLQEEVMAEKNGFGVSQHCQTVEECYSVFGTCPSKKVCLPNGAALFNNFAASLGKHPVPEC